MFVILSVPPLLFSAQEEVMSKTPEMYTALEGMYCPHFRYPVGSKIFYLNLSHLHPAGSHSALLLNTVKMIFELIILAKYFRFNRLIKYQTYFLC